MLNKLYETRKYNGVNHDITLYNTSDYTMNRKGQYFLTNQDSKPTEIIRQSRPLSIQSTLVPIAGSDTQTIFLPEAIGVQIETLPNPFDYDIIIVSGRYAEIARQTQGSNLEYLDRLYTPIPLYSCNPQFATAFTTKVGCVGFRKVWYPCTPQYYVTELRSGRLPSVSSMRTCIEIYNTHRAYCDYNTTSWLRELENSLASITTSQLSKKGGF